MARNGLPYFPLDVNDYLEDEAVILMSAEAEGCYIRLLCRSWKSKTPGVVSVALVPELAGIHRVPKSEHERVLSEIARAFKVGPDSWTQARMVAEWRRADGRYKAMTAGARKTNAAKDMTRLASATRALPVTPSERYPQRLAATGVGVGVGVESDSEQPLTLGSILPGQKSTAPASKPESNPVALRPERQTQRPDPDAQERATCHRCRNRFMRPTGSQRSLCGPCKADDNDHSP